MIRAIPLVALCLAASALAEPSHSPLHGRGGLTLAWAPPSSGVPHSFGLGAIAEPTFSIMDQLRVGLRAEGAVLAGVNIGGGASSVYAGMHVVAAGLVKVEYDLLAGDVRPFVGAAAGYYVVVVLGGGTGGASVLAGQGFGAMPQLGVNFGGFRVAALYHAIFTGPGSAGNYLALELSWRVG